ncbi:hypothetical protein SAMN05444171_7770 [Bradyrhizobium lablabi]|uniref:ABC transporter permease n=2 Tax=Bradyrhizobium TaxID=374 RepID=A0ABY0QFB9_9BRAD|nr:hypothetical protein SAMN05444163_7361 [Bradyrhizobium ottawaense]SEE50511.1 hypothetical protein SAMN05444171_7770 [Bradyrhizobium lablabi]
MTHHQMVHVILDLVVPGTILTAIAIMMTAVFLNL